MGVWKGLSTIDRSSAEAKLSLVEWGVEKSFIPAVVLFAKSVSPGQFPYVVGR
jgi:hypothetical protein